MMRNTMPKLVSVISGTALTCTVAYLFYKTCKKVFQRQFNVTSPVYVCDDVDDWKRNEEKFVQRFNRAGVIGLDCEWVTLDGKNKRNPVALLQLATADGLCVLIRLCKIPSNDIPDGLLDCLLDPNIIKVGVGVIEDSRKLLCDYDVFVRSCLDLRHIVQDHPSFRGKGPGLKLLAEKILGVKLKKSSSLTCSNWEAEALTPKQVAYAAEDALAAAQIFEHLITGDRSWWHGLFPYMLVSESMKKYEQFLDIPFKLKETPVFISETDPPGSQKCDCVVLLPDGQILCYCNRNRAMFYVRKKNAEIIRNNPFTVRLKRGLTDNPFPRLSLRSKVMYDNCIMQAPDGQILCSCDKNKAMYYIRKELADIITDDPLTIRLKFEPSERPYLDNTYYTQKKENCCVVCGKTKFFHRKQVVPSEYRKYFPVFMKKSLSHDVLLLCTACHLVSNARDQALRNQLAVECDAPIGSGFNVKQKKNPDLIKIKSAATALVCLENKIPQKRKDELMNRIKEFYKMDEVSEEFLKELSDTDPYEVNENYIPHGKKVCMYFHTHGGLIQLEKLWRQNFLDTMKPKFLPTMWSVDHNHQRLAVQILKGGKEIIDFDVSILGLTKELMEKAKEIINQEKI